MTDAEAARAFIDLMEGRAPGFVCHLDEPVREQCEQPDCHNFGGLPEVCGTGPLFDDPDPVAVKAAAEVIVAATRRQVAEELLPVLVAHQRHRGGCLCGWNELGRSHPAHIVAEWAAIARGRGETPQPPTH